MEKREGMCLKGDGRDGRTELIREIRGAISEGIDLRRDTSDEEIREMIVRAVFARSRDDYLDMDEKREIIDAVFNSMRRLDVLQPVIEDKSVTEVMINGPDSVFIERDGRVSRLDIKFESSEKLEDIIQNIVSRTNRTVNEASPIVDVRLPDGSRVNIVLKPAAIDGPIMTIRKFPDSPMTMRQLIALGALTEEAADTLERLVKAKYNIFICGGTGSGKTTFLNALSGFIPGDERIITIEDSAELRINGIENLVRLETRNANTEGKGQITIRDLIRTSLRMRPERIIVGEVRGAEALDMLQAMNTGHDGSLSTGHANSPSDMLSRLETMVLSGAALPLEAVRRQIASAIDVIIHLSRLRDRSRRVVEISEVAGCPDGRILISRLFEFTDAGDGPDGRVAGLLKRTDNSLLRTDKLKMAGISGI
jgi:pilus assembly protein CpaF